MLHNRDDQRVSLSLIEKVDDQDTGYSLRKDDGWSLWVSKEDLGGFVPQVGDTILTAESINNVSGIVIEGHVVRWKSKAQVDADFEQWKKNYRLEKLERYIKHGEALKARARNLPLPLRKRMFRFDAEFGIDFWIDSADYEMAAMEGAAALLRKVQELELVDDIDDTSQNTTVQLDAAVAWIKDWWNINSDKHDPPYDYAKQMELVPDFGDGHSGNTAGAAYSIAIAILEGREV